MKAPVECDHLAIDDVGHGFWCLHCGAFKPHKQSSMAHTLKRNLQQQPSGWFFPHRQMEET